MEFVKTGRTNLYLMTEFAFVSDIDAVHNT